jgi:hypothetical protein
MRHRHTFAEAARRFVAALGLAAALSSATMVAAPAAHASESVGAGRAVGVVHAGEAGRAVSPPYAYLITNAAKIDCPLGYMCLWTGNYFSGTGLFMLGAGLARCEGYRFEGTIWQDNVGSIWNRLQGGPSSVWNRRADGSYHYAKIASIGTGYNHDTAYSRSMDAFVWDPANTCRNLTLHHVVF